MDYNTMIKEMDYSKTIDCLEKGRILFEQTKDTNWLLFPLNAAVEALPEEPTLTSKFFETFISMHKMLLCDLHVLDSLDVLDMLLKKVTDVTCTNIKKHKIALHKYLWEYFKAHSQSLDLKQNNLLVRCSLGFLLSISIEKTDLVAEKLMDLLALCPDKSAITSAESNDISLTIKVLGWTLHCVNNREVHAANSDYTSAQTCNNFVGHFNLMNKFLIIVLHMGEFVKAKLTLNFMCNEFEARGRPIIHLPVAKSMGESLICLVQILYGEKEDEWGMTLKNFANNVCETNNWTTSKDYQLYMVHGFLENITKIIKNNRQLGRCPTTNVAIPQGVFDTALDFISWMLKLNECLSVTSAEANKFHNHVVDSLLALINNRMAFGVVNKRLIALQSKTQKLRLVEIETKKASSNAKGSKQGESSENSILKDLADGISKMNFSNANAQLDGEDNCEKDKGVNDSGEGVDTKKKGKKHRKK